MGESPDPELWKDHTGREGYIQNDALERWTLRVVS